MRKVFCKKDVVLGLFFVRDNIVNFFYWCRYIGVDEIYFFEFEGLGKYICYRCFV